MFVEILYDLEESSFEKIILREFKRLYFELFRHNVSQLVNQNGMTVILDLFVVLDAFIHGRVEEVE